MQACLSKTSFLRGKLPRRMHGVELRQARLSELQYFSILAPVIVSCTQGGLADLEIMPHTAAGLNNLQMADEHVIACQGTADRLQILVGPHKQRVSLVAAETGTDDVIIGGEVLEIAQDGFRRAGFWSMCVDGKTLEIPYWAA